MSSIIRKHLLERILLLKFEEQTQEVKNIIQKLQQKVDEFGNGEHK